MTLVVTTTPQYKFKIDPVKKEQVDSEFARFGVMKHAGMNRLIDWFLGLDDLAKGRILLPPVSFTGGRVAPIEEDPQAEQRARIARRVKAARSDHEPEQAPKAGRKGR